MSSNTKTNVHDKTSLQDRIPQGANLTWQGEGTKKEAEARVKRQRQAAQPSSLTQDKLETDRQQAWCGAKVPGEGRYLLLYHGGGEVAVHLHVVRCAGYTRAAGTARGHGCHGCHGWATKVGHPSTGARAEGGHVGAGAGEPGSSCSPCPGGGASAHHAHVPIDRRGILWGTARLSTNTYTHTQQ